MWILNLGLTGSVLGSYAGFSYGLISENTSKKDRHLTSYFDSVSTTNSSKNS